MTSTFLTACIAKEAECADLRLQLARLMFLYGDATAKLEAATATKCKFIYKDDDKEDDDIVSVSESDVSADESTQVSTAPVEEDEDVFQDASAKAPTTYNKAKYESACRMCLCGGKTSAIKSRAKIHESSILHQMFIAHNEMSSIE